MYSSKLCAIILVQFAILSICSALECYVCTDQEDNVEKCLNTIKTCEHYEDVCLSEIKWGSTPYWSQGAQKQFYISKRCATKEQCVRTRQHHMQYCTHIWYEDWACSECCQGDRCNYYVFNAGVTAVISLMVLVVPLATVFVGRVVWSY